MHYRVLVHEGNVVTVEGGVMQEPKAPETVTTLPECTNAIMHTKLVSKFMLLTYPKQPLVFERCALSR